MLDTLLPTIKNINQFLQNQFITIIFIWVCSIFLAYPDRDIIQITIGIIFMHFWIYFVHRGVHMLPKDGIIGALNTHWLFHHQHNKLLDRRIELTMEMFTDIAMNTSILLIQWLTNIWFVPLSVGLFFTIVYTSVHIINYSMIGSDTHKKHHMNHDTNFGPDTIDHIFGSSEDGEFEDLKPVCINIIISFCVVLFLKTRYGWED